MKDRPTIIDVAKQAGVSKSTVSRVVSGEGQLVSDATRRRVNDAIRQLGYEYNAVAGGMRTNRTNLIMLSIPDINNPFWPEVARGVQDFMEKEGYGVVFANNDWQGHREVNYLHLARRNGLDGILINPIEVTNQELVANQIPAVILGMRSDYPDFDAVGSDSARATYTALEYLTGLGHHRIGLLLGKHQNSPRRPRLEVYLSFMSERGIPVEEDLIVEVPFTHEGGLAGMETLLCRDHRPTAVLGSNDVIAIGALHAAVTLGYRVPDDVSIMGIDNIYASSTTVPALSTIEKPKYEIGYQAAGFLLERMRGEVSGEPRQVACPCRLIVRDSTAPPA